eukprot:Polyplicarium_translucidae@DN2606_c0_g1_i4.p1
MSDEPELACYESPLAQPRVRRKALKRCLKLLRKVTKSADGQKRRTLKRGVVEVTKTIRKEGGGGGLVFMASDVFPVDIISHLPAFCESKDLPYAFVGPKALLGEACGSVRPASVVMLPPPRATPRTPISTAKSPPTCRRFSPDGGASAAGAPDFDGSSP